MSIKNILRMMAFTCLMLGSAFIYKAMALPKKADIYVGLTIVSFALAVVVVGAGDIQRDSDQEDEEQIGD